jgi:hypothetical protein
VEQEVFCDLLELKLPSMPMITGTDRRPQVTRKLAAAIAQLHDYAEAIDDPGVRDRLEARGFQMLRPRLFLVAGRSAGLDRARLIRATSGDDRIRIHTWDDLVMRARHHLL